MILRKCVPDWEPWFAWHPVQIGDYGDVVWLEWVKRHSIIGIFSIWQYDYPDDDVRSNYESKAKK